MNFGDQNLSSNPEKLSFSTHHFTHSKRGGINSIDLGVFRKIQRANAFKAVGTVPGPYAKVSIRLNKFYLCCVAPYKPSCHLLLSYLSSDLLSAYYILGVEITKMSKAKPLPLNNL